jgi:ClpP class serine protease
MARFIDIQDSESVLRAIKLTDPKVPIDLILHTPGGLVLASEQIANALSRHPARVTVFVPHYAMSGGTLIALAANEIVMDENAVLGPVDPQVGQYPAVSILKVLENKDPNKIDDNTMILADIAGKAVNQVKATIRRLGCCHYTRRKKPTAWRKTWHPVAGRMIIPSAPKRLANWVSRSIPTCPLPSTS